ncbi:MAG TPA: hypothetical protein DCM28_00340 [Phycisphaerales bacterium]|nr:hypothetical protein [Phycisphaerales bacterium]|tara:strand:- start:1409 stop:2236 length:828 start_codon:yes stop_codon:yes gene_type:complete
MNFESYDLTLNRSNYVRCELGWELPLLFSQKLDDYDLWMVWAGSGTMQLHDGNIELHPGMCIWMRPGGLYLSQQDNTNRLGVSAQHFDLINPSTGKRPRDKDLPPQVIHMPDIPAITGTMRTIARLNTVGQQARNKTSKQALASAQLLMRGLLMEVCYQAHVPKLHLSPTDHMHRSIITQLAADMTASPQDIDSIESLATDAGYSPAHFSRVFKHIMGISPQRHLMESRIHRARHLLIETDWSITRIAQVMGYNDVYFFSRQFKQITGQTPSSVR